VRSAQYRLFIDSAGRSPESWGKFDYRHMLNHDVETIALTHSADIDQVTRTHFPSLKAAVEREFEWLREGGRLVTSFELQIVRIERNAGQGSLPGGSHATYLLHDLLEEFGVEEPPFNPDWLTSTVTALARSMDKSRDYSSVPILADALEEAGCDNLDVLTHCRGPGPHASGCWVVDAILGKS
jgi:hypothetical protein